jgi:C2 domain
LKRSGTNPYKNIIKPTYTLDANLNVHREGTLPPDSLYIGLGYDENPEENKKHYRRYYPDELENVTDLMGEPPFLQYMLKRGQTRGASKSFFSFGSKKEDASGAVSTEQIVGKFKCLIDIDSKKDKEEHKEIKDEKLHNLKVKLNSLSLKKKGKPMDFNLEKLDSAEGKMKFRVEMESLGIAHLDITKYLSSMTA